ncbi:fatty acyl-AMP ligase [Nocardia terpenica]|uniref:AMP-binding protein n=1 Tax=Nocardia terpenica TaxID=455432 RepID=A0A6G9Z1R0_9NOCA|nr:fatty acyl-AMP ligase [Nocardia terpenica]QIS19412.1 AMP-binding protein [Nocardia terpenica]
MNRFTTALIDSATRGDNGIRTGDPAALTRTSWRAVHAEARRIAGGLVDAGLRRGGAVAVLAAAPADIAPLVQGIWLAGGTVTMLHQPTPRADLADWAADTRRALAVIDAQIVVLGAPFETVRDPAATARWITVDELRTGPDLDPVATADADLAFLQLTSGSTGAPKAVAVTYANMYANIRAMEFVSLISVRRDVMVSWLPLFHDMGMMGFLVAPMFLGVDLISVTPADFLTSPLIWARLVSDHGGTMSAAPNFAYGLLARKLGRAPDGAYDLSSLRFALNGAEPIDHAVVQRFLTAGARFGLRPDAIVPAYGMAEATLAVSFARPGTGAALDRVDPVELRSRGRAVDSTADDAATHVRLGTPLPGIEVRVRAESGALAGIREVGEIEVRGDSIIRRYRTADGFVDAVDESGWLATGDLGYLTEDRQIVVCGRKKDMLIVSGRNIFPVDVERLAAGVAGVRAGNAVAVRTADASESFAVIVESAASGADTERVRIAREVATRVQAGLGVGPRRVEVVAPGRLPKTPSGKLRRLDAAALLAEGPIGC